MEKPSKAKVIVFDCSAVDHGAHLGRGAARWKFVSCVCAAVPVCVCRWCQRREDVRARSALPSRGQPDVLSGFHIAVKEKTLKRPI